MANVGTAGYKAETLKFRISLLLKELRTGMASRSIFVHQTRLIGAPS